MKDFKLWYREIINEKIKSQNIWKESRFHLLQAPVPHRPLRKGYLYKLGYNVKSWKRRYFVAYNKTDNFILKYYDDNTLSRCRGSIDCCGYNVRTFTADEDEHNYGIYGIQLVHNEDNKRVWSFRMATEKEQDAWIQIFLNACKKTSAHPTRDIYYLAAFQRALKATKASYGYYGLCEVVTSELEQLCELTKRILRREIVDEYIQTHHQQLKRQQTSKRRSSSRNLSVAPGEGVTSTSPFSFVATSSTHPQQDSIIVMSEVNDIVNALIQPIITSTHKRLSLYVSETTSKYEDSVKTSLPQLMQTERVIYDFLLKKLKSLVDPTLHDLHERIFAPIMEKMSDKLLLSYVRLLLNFSQQLVEKTRHFQSYSDTLRGIDRLDNVIDTISNEDVDATSMTSAHCLAESYDILWTLMTKELIDVADVFEGCDIQPFSVIYLNTTEDMRQCLHNFLFTFKCLLKNDYDEQKTAQRQRYGQYSFWLKSLFTSSPNTPPSSRPHTPQKPSAASDVTTDSSKMTSPPSSSKHSNKARAETPPPPPHTSSSMTTAEIVTRLELLYSYFEHDVYELLISRCADILSDMAEITVQEALLMPGQEIFAAAKGLEREFSFIVHLPCLGERIVRDCVRAYLNHFLTASITSFGVRVKLQLQECRQSIWQRMKASSASLSFLDAAPPSFTGGEGSIVALPSESAAYREPDEFSP